MSNKLSEFITTSAGDIKVYSTENVKNNEFIVVSPREVGVNQKTYDKINNAKDEKALAKVVEKIVLSAVKTITQINTNPNEPTK